MTNESPEAPDAPARKLLSTDDDEMSATRTLTDYADESTEEHMTRKLSQSWKHSKMLLFILYNLI